jgi:phospholipase/carboxylesterase
VGATGPRRAASRFAWPLLVAVLGLSAGACRPADPPAAPDTTSSLAEPVPAPPAPQEHVAAPAPAPRRPRPTAAPAPRGPALPLVEHAGSVDGPIQWRVAESTTAAADAPLIVLLHGRGDHAEAFLRLAWRLAPHLPRSVRFIAAEAPRPFGLGRGRQWFDPKDGTPETSLAARLGELDTFLAALAARYPEAPRPTVVGFSQGGMVALHLALQRPGAIAAAVSLSGALAAEARAEGPSGARPAVLVAYGRQDTVIEPGRTEAAANVLEAAGHAVTRFAFDGGHRVPDALVEEVGRWLAAHLGAPPEAEKGTAPAP